MMEEKQIYHVYGSRMGGIYLTEDYYIPSYCEQCGGWDYYLGEVSTSEELRELVTDEDGYCPYSEEFLKKAWE